MKAANKYSITPDKFLDANQRKQLLKVCKEKAGLDLLKGRTTWPARYMLVDLALYSGLRVAEICDLKHGDISHGVDPYIMVNNGKGSKKRVVYIDLPLAKHIRKFESYKKRTLKQPIGQNDYLFPGRNGSKSPTITLQKSFKVAIDAAGLPDHYSIHACRHTFATFLLRDTGNLRYVQKQLGHSNSSMTAIYADILPEENGKLARMIKRD